MLHNALLEIAPGPFVPAGLPIPAQRAQASTDAAEMVWDVLAASAEARGRMAWGRAETHAREAADLAPRAGVPALAAAALNELCAVRLTQGSVEGIAELAARAAEVGQGSPEELRARVNLAVARALGGDLEGARAELEGAAKLVSEDDGWGAQLVRLNRAALLCLSGDLARAGNVAADALRAGRREKQEQWIALASLGAACVYRARGARNVARGRLVEAARSFVRGGDLLRAVQSHYLLGEIAYESEDPIRAGSHYRDGLAIAREAGASHLVELLTLRFEHR